MFAVTVTFTLNSGASEAFLALIRNNAQASRNTEPGCRQFDVCSDPDRPDTVFLYELYDDAAAFDAHRATAHFQSFDADVAELVAAKSVATFSEVSG